MQSIQVNLRHLVLCACFVFGTQLNLEAQPLSTQNLIPNASFETGVLLCGVQGQMPAPWVVVSSTPDTYNFNCPDQNAIGGLSPILDYGNFTSMPSAEDGFRFAAGWSQALEDMGVPLNSALVPGHDYGMRGWFARPNHHDAAGYYDVYLSPSLAGISGAALLGTIGGNVATAALGVWALDAFEFTAPANAGQLPYLILEPSGGDYYAALDDLFLTEVFAPTTFCFGDGSGAACPCGNSGVAGHGCENSASTGGALLTAMGTPSLSADTLVLTSSGERATSFSLFLQGDLNLSFPALFGDGLRCTGGNLKRLYTRNAAAGSVTAPMGVDPSITMRSASLGDPIPPFGTRFYQVYYRDPSPSFCPNPPGSTFNVSNAVAIIWGL